MSAFEHTGVGDRCVVVSRLLKQQASEMVIEDYVAVEVKVVDGTKDNQVRGLSD